LAFWQRKTNVKKKWRGEEERERKRGKKNVGNKHVSRDINLRRALSLPSSFSPLILLSEEKERSRLTHTGTTK
jgi:hypothetical protein